MEKSNLTPSLEDYMEAILELEQKNRVARVKEIAEKLNVQMPSVTGALKNLKKKGLINYEKNSFISLTDEGMKIADSILQRHTILTEFLKNTILMPEDEAQDLACKLEHHIPPAVAKRMDKLGKYVQQEIFEKQGKSREEWDKIISEKN